MLHWATKGDQAVLKRVWNGVGANTRGVEVATERRLWADLHQVGELLRGDLLLDLVRIKKEEGWRAGEGMEDKCMRWRWARSARKQQMGGRMARRPHLEDWSLTPRHTDALKRHSSRHAFQRRRTAHTALQAAASRPTTTLSEHTHS